MKTENKIHRRDAIVKKYELSLKRTVTKSEAERMLAKLYPDLANLYK